MKTEPLTESAKCQATADDLLTEVSHLLDKSETTFDASDRFELYRQAMEKSSEAHELIAKARELKEREEKHTRENTRIKSKKAYPSGEK